jgi:hypothetical protein
MERRVGGRPGRLWREQLGQPAVLAGAYGVAVRAQVAILAVLNEQIALVQEQVEAHFGQHPHAEIYTSQPELGAILGARVLAEFGDDPTRYGDAKARKNYAGTSPITRQSGKKKVVLARHVHNDRLLDALGLQAFAAISRSPGARAYYDRFVWRLRSPEARGLGRVNDDHAGCPAGCARSGGERSPARPIPSWFNRLCATLGYFLIGRELSRFLTPTPAAKPKVRGHWPHELPERSGACGSGHDASAGSCPDRISCNFRSRTLGSRCRSAARNTRSVPVGRGLSICRCKMASW